MVVLRCTQELLLRINPLAERDAPASTTRLGDWYGHVIRMGNRHVVLFLSEHSRLPILLPIRDARTLGETLPAALAATLAWLGVADSDIAIEMAHMSTLTAARTNNRSVLGTMNDFGFGVRVSFATRRDQTIEQTARWLATTPIMPLKGACPVDLTRAAFGLPPWPWAMHSILVDGASE